MPVSSVCLVQDAHGHVLDLNFDQDTFVHWRCSLETRGGHLAALPHLMGTVGSPHCALDTTS